MENKKNKLDKKSISIIIIVAIFLVIIMAITFAYFGNFFVNLGNMLNVNLSAGELSNAYLNATNTSFSIDIDPENMSEDNAGNFVITNESSLNVFLDAGTTSFGVKCTYDIMFEYDSTSSIYGKEPTPVSDGATKEFTLQASGPTTFSNFFKEETNFAYDSNWSSNPYRRTIASNVEIINTSSNNPIVQTWIFTNKFYNLDLDQTALANKKFKGRFYVDNTHCETTQIANDSETLYALVQNKYNEGNTFVKLYDGEGSDSYANPVYYYNGAVQDNNVYFADLCWKMVRTTDTGGVKLIYNGTPKTITKPIPIEESQYLNVSNDANYPYTFDSTNKTWTSTNKTNSATGTITFTVAEAGDYFLSYTVSSEANWDKAIFYKDGTTLGTYSGEASGSITLDGLTTSNVIKVEYTKDSSGAIGSDNVVFSLDKPSGNSYLTCNNTGTDSQIGTSSFNGSYDSLAYVGYMYNTEYTSSSKTRSQLSNIVFGNSFTYSGGTYTLADTMTVATWSSGYNTINNNHYTCFTTGTTCPSLYYVHYADSSNAYYITLTGGKSVSDALNEMLYVGDVNKTNSIIKTYIETWYENNMTAYTSSLEDTTYCNDRSIINLNGWNPNGGSTTGYLQFKNYNDNYSLVCGSVTDQFRVGNTKAPLKYPVGLLTAPEVLLAYKDANYSTYYLNTEQIYWLGSPSYFINKNSNAYVRLVSSSGNLSNNYVNDSIGVRPSVSLKPGTEYISGNGSYTSPFLIE
ncbi:MAG: hypothetical protein PUD07_05110 [bacterium]|nr:hypothetical protein [bacterium]